MLSFQDAVRWLWYTGFAQRPTRVSAERRHRVGALRKLVFNRSYLWEITSMIQFWVLLLRLVISAGLSAQPRATAAAVLRHGGVLRLAFIDATVMIFFARNALNATLYHHGVEFFSNLLELRWAHQHGTCTRGRDALLPPERRASGQLTVTLPRNGNDVGAW